MKMGTQSFVFWEHPYRLWGTPSLQSNGYRW